MNYPLNQFMAGLLTLSLLACQAQSGLSGGSEPPAYTNAEGVLIVSVYSRGAYQYVLAVPDATGKRLYPVNLADSLKQLALKTNPATPLTVRFSGRLTGKEEMIRRTTANDAGADDAPIPQITLSAISVR